MLDISFYLEWLEAEYKSVLPQCLKNALEALEKLEAEFDKDTPKTHHLVLSKERSRVWLVRFRSIIERCTVVLISANFDSIV